MSHYRNIEYPSSDLRAALISGDQLELHYQTQQEPASGELVGMEALLRWRHLKAGMISPGDFIPLAERHGLISQLGTWVIEKADDMGQYFGPAALSRRPGKPVDDLPKALSVETIANWFRAD